VAGKVTIGSTLHWPCNNWQHNSEFSGQTTYRLNAVVCGISKKHATFCHYLYFKNDSHEADDKCRHWNSSSATLANHEMYDQLQQWTQQQRVKNLVLKICRVVEHCSLVGRCAYVILHHVLLLRHVTVELGNTYIVDTLSGTQHQNVCYLELMN